MHGARCERRLRGANLLRARPPVAPFDLDAHALAAAKLVEVQRGVEAGAMEEVLLSIIGRNESEAALRHDLLAATSQHLASPIPSRRDQNRRTRPFDKVETPTSDSRA